MRRWIGYALVLVVVLIVIVNTLSSLLTRSTGKELETVRTQFAATKPATITERTVPATAPPESTRSEDSAESLKELVVRFCSHRGDVKILESLLDEDAFKGPRPLTEAELDTAKALLARQEALLNDFRAFLQTAPDGTWPELTIERAKTQVALWDCWTLADLLALSVQASVAAGNTEAAIDDCVKGFRLARVVPSRCRLQWLCWMIAMRSTMSGLPETGLTKAQQARVVDAAQESILDREEFARTLTNEVELLAKFYREPLLMAQGASPYQATLTRQCLVGLSALRVSRPLCESDEAFLLSAAKDVLMICRQPYYEVSERANQLLARRRGLLSLQPFARISSIPAICFVLQLFTEADQGLLQIGLAVEDYKAEKGVYPVSLDDIAPISGKPLPLDPFTGRPYRYEVQDGTFLLYSVSRNQTDEHGDPSHDQVWRPAKRRSSTDQLQQGKAQ